MHSGSEEELRAYYRALCRAWGCPHWWPARSRFEVIVGAYLTQNTSWANVERALLQLRSAHALNIRAIREMTLPALQALIRSSGYFRQKAQRLKAFVAFLDERYEGSPTRMFAQPTAKLREELLALNGVGPETADSILLYAGQHSVFVVDAYTRRILERHGIVPEGAPYEEIRNLCERALGPEMIPSLAGGGARATLPGTTHPPSRMSLARRAPAAQVYNDMHGMIVAVGKHYCLKSQPNCDGCPLQSFLLPGKRL